MALGTHANAVLGALLAPSRATPTAPLLRGAARGARVTRPSSASPEQRCSASQPVLLPAPLPQTPSLQVLARPPFPGPHLPPFPTRPQPIALLGSSVYLDFSVKMPFAHGKTSASSCRHSLGPCSAASRFSPLATQHILFLLSFLFSREGGWGAGARGDFAMPCRDGGEGRKGASSRLCAGDTVPAPFRLAVSDVLGRGERGTSMDMSVCVYVASLAKMLTFRVNDLCFRSAAPSSPGTPSATFGL